MRQPGRSPVRDSGGFCSGGLRGKREWRLCGTDGAVHIWSGYRVVSGGQSGVFEMRATSDELHADASEHRPPNWLMSRHWPWRVNFGNLRRPKHGYRGGYRKKKMSDPELESFKTIDLRAYAAGQGYQLDRKASWRGSAVMRNQSDDKIIIKRA